MNYYEGQMATFPGELVSGVSKGYRPKEKLDLTDKADMTPQLEEVERRLLKCSFRMGDCDWCKKERVCQDVWDSYCPLPQNSGRRSMRSPLEDMINSFQKVGIL